MYEESETAAPADDSDPEPMFIHLDRPCDDEMVQTFVRIGHQDGGLHAEDWGYPQQESPGEDTGGGD